MKKLILTAIMIFGALTGNAIAGCVGPINSDGLTFNSGDKIKLKSWKGDYLHRPDSNQGVTTWNTGIGNEWTLEVSGGVLKFKSWKGDYLHRPDSPQGVTTWNVGIGNEWAIVAVGSNISLKSWKNDYLHRPDSAQGVTTWNTGIGNEWTVEVISSGNIDPDCKEKPKNAGVSSTKLDWYNPYQPVEKAWLTKKYIGEYATKAHKILDLDVHSPFVVSMAELDGTTKNQALLVHWTDGAFCNENGCRFDIWLPNANGMFTNVKSAFGTSLGLAATRTGGMLDIVIDDQILRWNGTTYQP